MDFFSVKYGGSNRHNPLRRNEHFRPISVGQGQVIGFIQDRIDQNGL